MGIVWGIIGIALMIVAVWLNGRLWPYLRRFYSLFGVTFRR